MARRALVVTVTGLLLAGTLVLAGQARSYNKPIEVTWDEAVKAVRDAELYVSDSNRSDHWFVMRTKRKGGYEMRVTLFGTEQQATVQVDAVDPGDSERSEKHIRRFLDALDRRLD